MEAVQKIEEDFASKSGLAGGVFFRSGTIALWMALESLQLPPGSRVAIPPLVCPQVLAAVQLARLYPVYIDISPVDFGLDPQALNETPNLQAIIAVHAFGIPCQMQQIFEIASNRQIPVIEDACLGYGLPEMGLGKYSNRVIISFGQDKLISAGGGSMVLSDDPSLLSNLRGLRERNPIISESGPDILEKIRQGLPSMLARAAIRRARSNNYARSLVGRNLKVPQGNALWRYPVVVDVDRRTLMDRAREMGLFLSTHYHPLHYFQTGTALPIADSVAQRIINLPLSEKFSDAEIANYLDFILTS